MAGVIYYLLSLILVASLFEMSEAQCLGRRPCPSSCGFDDINVLLTLARALDETETTRSPCRNGIDVEEIIMKLINALVYTTITSSNNGGGGRGNNGGSGGSGGTGGRGGNGGSGGNGNQNKSGDGLIDLGLLNPNDPDNILKLEIAKQKLLGVGLGDTSNN